MYASRTRRPPRGGLNAAIAASLAAGLVAGWGTPVHAFAPRPVPGRVVLTLRQPLPPAPAGMPRGKPELDAVHTRFAAQRVAPLFGPARLGAAKTQDLMGRIYVVDFAPEHDVETVRAAYAALAGVERAELDWMHPLHLETDDSGGQWYLQSTSGKDAHVTGGWNHSTGDTSIVLAIADSGVDWLHPDLGGPGPGGTGGNIWTNWAEFHGTPGVDDDLNGKVDDVRGWDFVQFLSGAWEGEDAAQEDADPRDFNGHGTHVAGIAGGRTNNASGIAGVGFRCRIMPLRIGGSVRDDTGQEQGVVLLSHAAQAIQYATAKGVVAINCSWGSSAFSPLQVAVDAAIAAGIVVVVSAGNAGNEIPSYLGGRGDCLDVAATTQGDLKASFSSYGPWVDVAAPGVDILSTYFDHSTGQHVYRALQGTSMSAPIVTGLVGLVKARFPYLSGAQVQQRIVDGADPLDASNPDYAGALGAGRVNALKTFGDRFLTVPADYPTLAKALVASAAGDTIAARGGMSFPTPLLVRQPARLLQGGWNASFTARDPGNPSRIEAFGSGPALELAAGIDSTTVVEGFHFSGGVARSLGSPSGRYGGGVLCVGASPLLRACTFTANSAGDAATAGGGGGGFFHASRARLVECTFVANTASLGAGLYALASDLYLLDCRVDSNQAPSLSGSHGGGIYVDGGSLVVESTRVIGNGPADEGGGLFARGARLALRDLVLESNRAGTGGGLSMREGSTLEARATVLRGNSATQLGGGIYALGSNASLANLTMHANSGLGAALFAQTSTGPWSVRNVICSNHATVPLFFFGTTVTLDYNLYWNNAAGDLQGASPGPHDLSADPRFVDAGQGDFALGLHSPALDSGDPSPEAADPDTSRNDRGAYGGPDARRRLPAAPRLLAARHVNGATSVAWMPTTDPEAVSTVVYRGADSTFVPGVLLYVGSADASRTSFVDVDGAAGDWYRLAAVDARGASSGFSAAQPAQLQDLPLTPAGGIAPRTQLSAQPTDSAPTPARLALHPGHPNPSNPAVRLGFDLPTSGTVRLDVLDVRGRVVRVVVAAALPAGVHAVVWDGRDAAGRDVASGIYVARLQAGNASATRKLTMIR